LLFLQSKVIKQYAKLQKKVLDRWQNHKF